MKIETLAVHGGYTPDPTTKAVAVPIYQTVAYAIDNTQHGADLFDLKVAGNIYSRIMNPTNGVLEARVAAMLTSMPGNANELISVVPPKMGRATLRQVAVNARLKSLPDMGTVTLVAAFWIAMYALLGVQVLACARLCVRVWRALVRALVRSRVRVCVCVEGDL